MDIDDEPFVPGQTFFEPRVIRGADPASLRILNALYAKDEQRVYYRFGKVPKADLASFRVLDPGFFEPPQEYRLNDWGYPDRRFQGYAKDDRQVFHYVLTIGQPSILRGADAETFEALQWGLARDRLRVYHERFRVDGAKPDEFRQINEFYSITNHSVYCHCGRVEAADRLSFRVLFDMYAKDDRFVYQGGGPIEGADPLTYEVIGLSFVGKDRHRVYAHGLPLAGADPETFVSVGGCYHKDKHRAYFVANPIPGADVKSFRYVHQNFAEDDATIYSSGYPQKRVS